MSKKGNDILRNEWTQHFAQMLKDQGEEVLFIKNNELAIPVVDSEGEEQYIKVVISVPTGSRDGDPFDGHTLAEDFKFQQEQQAIKDKEKEAAKAKKIERDNKRREQIEAMKAKRNTRI